MAEEEGFLNRWSRRKLAEKERAAEPAEPEEAPPKEEEGAPVEGAEEPPRDRHPAEDIDIDALTAESDFRIFLEAGVPAAVKRKALRKLWTTSPVFYTRDPLNDDFDLADAKTWGLGPPRETSWKFGRYADELEAEAKKAAEAAREGEAQGGTAGSEPEGPSAPPEEGDAAEDVAAAERDAEEEQPGNKA